MSLGVSKLVGAQLKQASRNTICRKPENSLSEIQTFLKKKCTRDIQELCEGLLNTGPHLDHATCTALIPQRRVCFIQG